MFDKLSSYYRKEREKREKAALTELKARYHAFRIFLENNGRALELVVTIDGQLIRERESELRAATEELLGVTSELVDGLNLLSGEGHTGLYALHGHLAEVVNRQLRVLEITPVVSGPFCLPLDHPDAADPSRFGRKAATLARLRQMSLPVPDGFVCSTASCRHFLATSGLAEKIRALLKTIDAAHEDTGAVVKEIREMILAAPLPVEIRNPLRDSYTRLALRRGEGSGIPAPLAVSVRSSGVSEDGADFSFAGQYSSILNVQGLDALYDAYREVIASAFSGRAMSYRHNAGMSPLDFDLAVFCMVMVEASCAGVLFTHDPSRPDSGRMVISAVPGLGTTAVGGSVPVDLYYPPRVESVCIPNAGIAEYPAYDQLDRERLAGELMAGAGISRKTLREVPVAGGGLRQEHVPEEEAELPLLSPAALEELTRLGEIIESLEQGSQDVEWAWSEDQGIAILQARPLRLAASNEGRRIRMPAVAAPLVSGICACSGKAIGRVRIVHSGAELSALCGVLGQAGQSAPCILVLPQSIVDAAYLLRECAGVVIDVGNPTDHLSCVAREYGVPMITGAETAMACLRDGQWVILDADNGLIINAPESVIATSIQMKTGSAGQKAGATAEASGTALTAEIRDEVAMSPERKEFRDLIVPLNLTDAFGPTFSPRECRSVHDLIRYTHEMAILSMFNAGDMVMEDAGNLLRPLEIGIPFSFLVIDVGGGVRPPGKKTLRQRLSLHDPLDLDDILSIPLTALCEGLTTPELCWHSGPDLEALPGIFSRTMLDSRGARPAGSFNYALTARDYLNLNARLEFHFAMLDAVCGRDSHANYIRFRFKGGGASQKRSRRRAVFLQHVLEQNAFYTSVVGDLVTASLTGASKEVVYQRLVMLGQLFGFSRFLDGVMTDDEIPLQLARQFLAGNFESRSVVAAREQ